MREHMAKAQWMSKETDRKPGVLMLWHLWVLGETCASAASHWGQLPQQSCPCPLFHIRDTQRQLE